MGGSRDFRADQRNRYDHEVTIAPTNFIWVTLLKVLEGGSLRACDCLEAMAQRPPSRMGGGGYSNSREEGIWIGAYSMFLSSREGVSGSETA